ncbi:glycosyltransferase [Bifidobacterium gallicum]|nr:glycosyltransferase [Bifidobacterium gallicum]
MGNVMVSVVVPVYSVPVRLFRKCIDSLKAQTQSDVEIIIVDDGSKDKELVNACDSYRDSCVVVHQKNGGVSVARNHGIEIAQGKWIAFVDADDWAEPDLLKTMVDAAHGIEPDIVVCDAYVEYASHTATNHFFPESASFQWDEDQRKKTLLQIMGHNKYYNPPEIAIGVPWAKLYRRTFLLENNLTFMPELRRMQDNIFNLYAFDAAEEVVYVNKPMMHYLKLESSRSTRYSPDVVQDFEKVLDQTVIFINAKRPTEEMRQAYYGRVIQSIHSYMKFWLYHPKNQMTSVQKRKALKNILKKDTYKNALKNFKRRGGARDVAVFATVLRMRCFDGLLGSLITWRARGKQSTSA